MNKHYHLIVTVIVFLFNSIDAAQAPALQEVVPVVVAEILANAGQQGGINIQPVVPNQFIYPQNNNDFNEPEEGPNFVAVRLKKSPKSPPKQPRKNKINDGHCSKSPAKRKLKL